MLERRYHDLVRDGKRRERPSDEQTATKTAYEVFSTTDKRKQYDEAIGLASSRRGRLSLRPLGMFSQTLSKVQQNWTTWEREILVVAKASAHFRSVVAGMIMYIHTDHLNNTSHNHALSYPDKILRMLLKVESLVSPVWMFEPGGCQFGDGLSRDPEGGDQARDEAEGKKHLPATLGKAFALVTRHRLGGTSLIDDAEEVPQRSAGPATRMPYSEHDCSASPVTRYEF